MRAAVTLVLLVLAMVYAILAFSGLDFLSARGRIGPGFFPQIIAALLVVMCLYSLVLDWRRSRHDEPIASYWVVVATVAGLSGFLVVTVYVLGALAGMILFMLLSLTVLNSGRHLTNALVGTLLPLSIFLLFRYGLNATMPQGMLGLHI